MHLAKKEKGLLGQALSSEDALTDSMKARERVSRVAKLLLKRLQDAEARVGEVVGRTSKMSNASATEAELDAEVGWPEDDEPSSAEIQHGGGTRHCGICRRRKPT